MLYLLYISVCKRINEIYYSWIYLRIHFSVCWPFFCFWLQHVVLTHVMCLLFYHWCRIRNEWDFKEKRIFVVEKRLGNCNEWIIPDVIWSFQFKSCGSIESVSKLTKTVACCRVDNNGSTFLVLICIRWPDIP